MMSQAKVILICGYRRTGKDTFFNKLSSGSPEHLFRWRAYKKSPDIKIVEDPPLTYNRISFGDFLKEEAAIVYGIPRDIPDDEKDVKQFNPRYNNREIGGKCESTEHTGTLLSPRDIYVEWGAIRRSQDPDYWCREAFIPHERLFRGDTGSDKASSNRDCYVVTDWRFRNESRYVMARFSDVLTVRLYRSEVPEPDPNIESEHDLDSYCTDVVLLRDNIDGEFDKMVEKFPQYTDYLPYETL